MGITSVLTTNNEYAERNVPFPVFLTITDNRQNEILYSNNLDDASWTKTNAIIWPTDGVSPLGTEDASRVALLAQADSYVHTAATTFTAGDVVVSSAFIWCDSGTQELHMTAKQDGGWGNYVSERKTITTTPTRFSITRTLNDNTNRVFIGGNALFGAPDVGFYWIWGAQMEKAPIGSLYQTTGVAAAPSTAATIKEVNLRLLHNGTTAAVSGVSGFFHERNSTRRYFQIPLSSDIYAETQASVGETGSSYGRTMFRWFDLRADVLIDDDTDYSILNVNESQSNVLTRGVITNPSLEYSGVKDFSKFENSGLIP